VIRKLLIAVVAALGLAVPAATAAPTTLTGELNGAPYTIVVPDNWNGALVVHAHGYRDLADHPGEVDDRSAPATPSPALEPVLLAQGYALAGSAYKTNGWAVQDGIADTRALVSHFRGAVGTPSRTLLWGFSMGSLVTLALAEQTAGHFDGYLAACAVSPPARSRQARRGPGTARLRRRSRTRRRSAGTMRGGRSATCATTWTSTPKWSRR
jgi:pimeloyl-ACP methyl ester carboxylesterase